MSVVVTKAGSLWAFSSWPTGMSQVETEKTNVHDETCERGDKRVSMMIRLGVGPRTDGWHRQRRRNGDHTLKGIGADGFLGQKPRTRAFCRRRSEASRHERTVTRFQPGWPGGGPRSPASTRPYAA